VKLILNETITTRGLLATFVIVTGLTISVGFCDHSSRPYTPAELFDLYDPFCITFISSKAILLLMSEVTYILFIAHEEQGRPIDFSRKVRPVCYSIVSATVGTQSLCPISR
jgi:hypothetical protein